MSEDRQFEPSQRRRQQAKEKGQTPLSRDFVSAGILLLIAMLAPSLVGGTVTWLRTGMAAALGNMQTFEATPAGLKLLLIYWAQIFFSALAPLFLVCITGAILLTYFQSGPVFTAYPITPRLDKLNPLTTIKRMFALRGLVELLKSLLKLALVAFTAYLVLRQQSSHLLLLRQMELTAGVALVGHIMWELLLKTALMMVMLGAADYAYQRYEHTRSLRMTQEEVKQENKETEGDPQVRGQMRRRRKKLLEDGISKQMAQASVVLANPTHVAVALYYQQGQSQAPVVVAKGRGRLAARIKQIARRQGIPVREEPPLARALYQACSLGSEIPANLYRAVAVILAEVYREAQRRRERLRLPGR